MIQVPISFFDPAAEQVDALADFFGMNSSPEVATPAEAVAVENLAVEAAEQTPTPPAPDIDPDYVTTSGGAETTVVVGEFIEPPAGTTADSTAEQVVPAPEQVELTAEMAHQQRIADAEQEYLQASMRVNEIEDEIGEKKAELKDAKELQQALFVRLRSIQSGDLEPDEDDDEEDGDSTELYEPEADGVPGKASAAADKPSRTAPSAPGSDEPWRSQPLRAIIEGTAGCGPKKLDAICEMLPTLGDFVDLQGKAGGMGIHTEMPKGVGRGLCDALEEKVLNWLSANRDKFGEAIETPSTPPGMRANDQEQISMEAATPEGTGASMAADDNSDSGIEEIASPPLPPPQVFLATKSSGIPPADADEIHAAQLRVRLETLRARPVDERVPPKKAVFEDGQHAGREDWPFTHCSWTAGPEQDSWLLGWLSARSE